ncbi:MAG TPA: FecR family protein [Opitutaceae bacterium]|jgi:hypothetical protein|nr:FecR family protein [Opitutaceae bacterium]
MKKPLAVGLCLGSLLVDCICPAADLKQSTFTQVVNDVRIVSAADSSEKPAMVNAVFNMPDLVRTGTASRAELVAEDNTITRVGANTIFSFDPANRTIDLQQGSLLFHSPKGKGGGTIHTGSATASVLGTTIIVTTTHNGGFKVIDLEGHVAIKFLNGLRQSLNPGQMTFVLPGGHPAPIINIRLDKLTSNSKLVQGFEQPLPSLPLIQQQIDDQDREIDSGKAQDTGLLVADNATPTTVQVVDANTVQSRDQPPAAPGTVDSSTLPLANIVSSPFTVGSFTFPFGFSAPNITIGTPTIDLSSYKNVSEFAFVATNGTLAINGSVAFNGLSSTAILDLYAQQFSFASGATVQADVGTFKLLPQTATTLKGVAIVDNAPASSAPGGIIAFEANSLASSSASTLPFPLGGINVVTPAAFSLTNGSSINAPNLPVSLVANSITLNDSFVQGSFVGLDGAKGVSIANGSTLKANAGNLGILTAGGDIDISASTLKAIPGASFDGANTGEIFFDAIGGAVNLANGTNISAADALSIDSDKGISISGSSVQGGPFVSIFGTTGVNITGNSNLTATAGDLFVFTGSGDVDLSASTFKAIAATPANASFDGSILIDAIGGAANLTNGTAISAAGSLVVGGNTGVTIADSTLASGNGTLINSNGAVSVTGSPTATGYTTTFTGNNIITAGTSLTVNGATFNADPASGSVTLAALSGPATLQNASVTAGTLVLNSNILSDSGSIMLNHASVNVGTLSLVSGINTGSINIQNSAISTGTPLMLTSGATSGSITVGNSSAQSDSTTLSGATGVSIANGSTVQATFGNLGISTTGGGIGISGSTLSAIAGPIIGDSSSGVVNIAATGGAVNISNNTTISTPTGLDVSSDTGISISGASSLTSEGGIFIEGDPSGTSAPVSVTGNSTLTSGTESNLVIQAGTALTVNGATCNADPVFGSVYMSSDSGTISVQNASINSGYIDLRTFSPAGSIAVQNTAITTNNLTLNSGDGILLDCNGLPPTGTGTSPQVNLTDTGVSGSSLTVNNTDFTSFPTVNMTAHTINLANVNFGGSSTVNLTCNTGQLAGSPNTGAASVPGDVNFITGVTYGGSPAQGHVNFSVPVSGVINIAGGAP